MNQISNSLLRWGSGDEGAIFKTLLLNSAPTDKKESVDSRQKKGGRVSSGVPFLFIKTPKRSKILSNEKTVGLNVSTTLKGYCVYVGKFDVTGCIIDDRCEV